MPRCPLYCHSCQLAHSILSLPLLQTWTGANDALVPEPRPDSVIADIRLDRPLVTPAHKAKIAALDAANGLGGVHFVGAYALFRVPLLESGVRTALAAAERITGRPRFTPAPAGPREARSSAAVAPVLVAAALAAAAVVLRRRRRL